MRELYKLENNRHEICQKIENLTEILIQEDVPLLKETNQQIACSQFHYFLNQTIHDLSQQKQILEKQIEELRKNLHNVLEKEDNDKRFVG